LPQVLSWWQTAQDCFTDDFGTLQPGFLSSVWMLVVGMERVFHLEQMDDPGFAVLSGNLRRCPSRFEVGAWRRHVVWNEVDRFCHRTSPWERLRGRKVTMSYDEHTIPRWTRKFRIGRGYITIRNKYMRCEKLFYGQDVDLRRFVTVKATPGNVELRDESGLLLRRTLRFGQPEHLTALFDAGAGKADADVRELLDFAKETPHLDVIVRACRRPHRMAVWRALPDDLFTCYEEPGDYRGAPPHVVEVGETRTVLKGESEAQAVRTIVCRQAGPRGKPLRVHPLFTSGEEPPREVLETFRQRQQEEQGFRVQVHDEFLNATTCGYDKQSPDVKRPRFCRGPLQLMGWLPALVMNACLDFAERLGSAWEGKFVRTLRGTFFNRAGKLYLTPTALVVMYDKAFPEQKDLLPVIDQINAEEHRIPWLNNRLLVLSARPPTNGP
jgi:hypothetical protein